MVEHGRGSDEKRYENESGGQFTEKQRGYMAMHGDAVKRDRELYVDGERVRPVDPPTKQDSNGNDEENNDFR